MEQHIRPIVSIARGQIEAESDVRLPAALRMPPADLGVTRMLQACDSMLEAAKPFEAALIGAGLPAEFLAQFQSARDELEAILGDRAVMIGSHVAARKGVEVELRRGRRAVGRLDAVVRATFQDNEVVLAA